MKKSTLNAIMIGVIITLVIAIGVVSIRLAIRPKVIVDPNDKFLEASEVRSEDDSQGEVASETEKVVVTDRVRITADNINVRSGPGTDYERLGSAYLGYDFELLSGGDEEWTKIRYDGKEAYVFTEYIEIIPMVQNEDGTFTEYVNIDSDN